MTNEPWQVPDPETGRASEERPVDIDPVESVEQAGGTAARDTVEGTTDVQEQVEPPD